MNRYCSAALSATAPAGRSGGTRAFASRNRTPPSQARSGVCLKTRHRRVSSTANHLIGSSPTGTSPNRPYPRRRLLVGAVGLEPTSPRAEDFKSPASANSATLPSRPTAAVYSTKSRHRLFPRWAQRGLFHGGSIFSPHQLGRRTGESTPAVSAAGVSAAAGRNARSVGKDAYHRSPRARAESAPCRMSVSLAV